MVTKIGLNVLTQPGIKQKQLDDISSGCLFGGPDGTRTPGLYCVILKSDLPTAPIRPLCVFLFGFLLFSGVQISIASNISSAFFSDCNTWRL